MNLSRFIKATLSFCYILLLYFSSFSQTINIEGTFKGFEGEQIYLSQYSDPFVFSEKILDSAKIDGQGRFIFKTTVSETQQVFFKLNNLKSFLYVEPNKKYVIKFLPKDTLYMKFSREMNTVVPAEIPSLILKNDSTDINLLIEKFNVLFSNFVFKNQKKLMDSRNKKLLESLQNTANAKFSKYNNEYLNTYIFYKIASLDMAESLTHKQKFAFRYFVNKPICYENTEYINLFNEYFKKYFEQIKEDDRHDSIIREVNVYKGYTGLIKYLSADTILKNDAALREFLLIKCLTELYNGNKNFNKEAIIVVLQKLTEQGVIDKNKIIAKSVLNTLGRCALGSNAPNFLLQNSEHKEIKLSDFKGKIVYLIFFASWSSTSIDELNALLKIYKKYEKDVTFIGVSCDKEVQTFWDFTRAHSYPFTMLHFGGNYQLLENYKIASLPIFVLIDAKGKIINYPTLCVSSGLENQLNQIILAKEQKIKKQKEDKKKKPLPKM